jgi:hypothetical protein
MLIREEAAVAAQIRKGKNNSTILVFSSGREWDCDPIPGRALGIDVTGEPKTYYGYDDVLWEDRDLTDGERRELAIFMIERWKEYGGL